MATTIITKHGTAAPVDGDLAQGELGVDLTNAKLYSSTDGTDIIEISPATSYVTGTFTPVLTNVTSYSVGHAIYTKIGNLVTASIFFEDVNSPNNTNQVTITGLPYTAQLYKGSGTVAYGSGYNTHLIQGVPRNTQIDLYYGNSGNNPENLEAGDLYALGFDGNTFDNLIVQIQYFTS